jgi:aldehyde dehydrogenase (NAD+)
MLLPTEALRSKLASLPTGGCKQSGIGRDLGRHTFEANLKTKPALMEL